MSDHGSLCFLSFERPGFLINAIMSAVENAGMPVEVIVHDDGSSPVDQAFLTAWLDDGRISRLILSPAGRNEGVGAAFNRCVKLSTGDPVVKLDQDLVDFSPGWLAQCKQWLDDDPMLGMLGLFKYHVDPVDWKKMNHRGAPGEYDYVDDFVGSAMVIPRRVLDSHGLLSEHSSAFAEDVEYKKGLQASGLELGLPRYDMTTNRGFGIGPSTVVVDKDTVRAIHSEPLIFGR